MSQSVSDNVAYRILSEHVRRRYADVEYPEAWRNLPEIPTKVELLSKRGNGNGRDETEVWNSYQKEPIYDPNIPHNIVNGPWPSTMDYLGTHYQLLREDGIATLRASIQEFRDNPRMSDSRETNVYTNVHIKGFQIGAIGAAFRVEFSHDRAGKRIRWEQSKRLTQGSMLALSPMNDGFGSICKVAIVAARPVVGGLDQNPPQVDLYWGNVDDLALDPSESYIMIEARSGYFEAYRHMLVAMQKLPLEKFSLANHIVALGNDVQPPTYLEEHPYLNLNTLVRPDVDPETGEEMPALNEPSLNNVNVLENFPHIPNSGMDDSQMKACQRMLTSKLAIVQGPPGTGKTFTSVSAIKTIVENIIPNEEPPIIIAAQTNHALDQLMNHVLGFEKNVVRLGGRSAKENVAIKKRTLYELRMEHPIPGNRNNLRRCKASRDRKIEEIQQALAPLLTSELLTHEMLLKCGIITEEQGESLYEDGWENTGTVGDSAASGLSAWLGSNQIQPIPRATPLNFGLPLEDLDLEFEQQQDQELEGAEGGSGENDADALQGTWIPYRRMFTGKASCTWDDHRVKRLLARSPDLFKIPVGHRGTVYRYFERMVDSMMLQKIRGLLREYQTIVDDTRITKWQLNINLIRHLETKVIGCTTTGLAKYRGLLAALQPRTLLVEEAAETLEGTIIAGMFDSLQQLILVGDHQQLQAHANIPALEKTPYNLAVSMFERLVTNSMGFTTLNRQRRMIPEIRKLLCIQPTPFYENLDDHPSVLDRVKNRPPVPGMGHNLYFFHHRWPEARNGDSSRYNLDEAEMITGFYYHLVLNGTKPSKITVLTFYNGQRKIILEQLKKHPVLGGHTYFNIFTVDSFQGEENDIILLSLVRSNEYQNIGFLDSKNRLVVALSRARRGLYIFGNAINFTGGETTGSTVGRDPLWGPVISHLENEKQLNINKGLPTVCSRHNTTVFVNEAEDFYSLAGGCKLKCQTILKCGHRCPHNCHPFDHIELICQKACEKTLPCGHGCSRCCGETHECSRCSVPSPTPPPRIKPAKENPVSGFSIRNQIRSPAPEDKSIKSSKDAGNKQQKGRVQTAHKGWLQSSLNAPKKDPPASSPGTAEKWRNFDAKKSDIELAKKRALEEAAAPKFDASQQVIHETYLPTTVENGIRVKHKGIRRIIPAISKGDNTGAETPSAATQDPTPAEVAVATAAKGKSKVVDLPGDVNSTPTAKPTPHPHGHLASSRVWSGPSNGGNRGATTPGPTPAEPAAKRHTNAVDILGSPDVLTAPEYAFRSSSSRISNSKGRTDKAPILVPALRSTPTASTAKDKVNAVDSLINFDIFTTTLPIPRRVQSGASNVKVRATKAPIPGSNHAESTANGKTKTPVDLLGDFNAMPIDNSPAKAKLNTPYDLLGDIDNGLSDLKIIPISPRKPKSSITRQLQTASSPDDMEDLIQF